MGERPGGQMRLAVMRPAPVEDGQACRQYARARWTESRERARFCLRSAIGGYLQVSCQRSERRIWIPMNSAAFRAVLRADCLF